MSYRPTRLVTVLALDPSVKDGREAIKTQIEIPNEFLDAGPRGSRVFVVDYDSSSDSFRKPSPVKSRSRAAIEAPDDPFEGVSDRKLLKDPDFRAWMTYGVVMKTLARFEFALGRRLSWSFKSHQIQVSPQAFADANAFYSDRAQGLFFGYFPSRDGKSVIYTSLSHEIIAHETTHALLDGLRERYTDPSSPQQAGFHEGFADIVALLSILSARKLVEKVVDLGVPDGADGFVRRSSVTLEALKNSGLFGLAQQMGSELAGVHGHALRRSITLPPNPDYLSAPEYAEAHTCGEVLVAAVLNAFLSIWIDRLQPLGDRRRLDRTRVAEEGAELADHLLSACIRAIDYCPPTDIEFGDFASALLTADAELNPVDDKYDLRGHLLKAFVSYGITPTSRPRAAERTGFWAPPPPGTQFVYDRTHYENMKSDPDELFRFLWENRRAFRLQDQAHTRVLSVRPCIRRGRDGFILRETVAEYHQQLTLQARELFRLGIDRPETMPPETEVTLYGGNAVIFDEYGHVKFNIGKSILDRARQSKRLQYLWEQGALPGKSSKERAFSSVHMRRSTQWYRSVGPAPVPQEEEE